VSTFEHLSVLISIILGMGVTHLLANVHDLVQARRRVVVYWLPILWSVIIFIGLVQWWWVSFAMHQQEHWNFFYFLFLLLRPVTLYLTAAFVLPRPGRGTCDLRAYYFDNRYWLFLLLATGNVLDGLRRYYEGQPMSDIEVWSNFVSAGLLGSLAISDDERWHAVIALLTAALFGTFIVTSALELG
jgi:hypothetical protein